LFAAVAQEIDAQPDAEGGAYVSGEVFRLGRDLRTLIDRELAPFGITTQQAALILVARRRGALSPAHVTQRLGTDAAGMSRLVDRLEAKGLVARESSPTDRRAVVITLTPAGRELAPQLAGAFRAAHHHLFHGLAEAELERFRSVLGRLRENLRAANAGHPEVAG
jgi:DNA-binding MarR family transcriptional regulator